MQTIDRSLPVDASAKFRNGTAFRDIIAFRQLLNPKENRTRFARCFITKLPTYAKGDEPTDRMAVDKIVAQAARYEYRIVNAITAIVDSPLFREE